MTRHKNLGPEPTWYVVVRLGKVVPEGTARHYLEVVSVPGLRAIGPISWTWARALIWAWEAEHGVGTAAATEHPPRTAKIVDVSAR